MTQTTKVAPRTVNRNFAYDVVRDVDVVFDAVGGETLDRSWKVLRPGGRLVTIVSVEKAADERGRAAFFIVEPNARQLDEVARLPGPPARQQHHAQDGDEHRHRQ